jgi:glycosyltransferase involved in cell wall biosynthesis
MACALRVVVIGAFAPDYARHYVLLEGLRACGANVDVRAFPLSLRTPGRLRALARAFPRHNEADAVFIPAFNQLLGPAAWALGRLRGVPVLMDYLVGLSDVAADRGREHGARAAALRQVDRFNLRRLPLLTDTQAHRAWFEQVAGRTLPQMRVIPVGVRDLPLLPPPDPSAPLVQYTGTYIPFHGVEVILDAARLLPDVPFELIGSGQTYSAMAAHAESLGLANVRFRKGRFPKDELTALQAASTIMLGVFGATAKTGSVVPNKLYEALALGRPVITAESVAVREFMTPGEHLVTVPPGNADALAAAIRGLLADPARQAALREAGRRLVEARYLPPAIGAQMAGILETLR